MIIYCHKLDLIFLFFTQEFYSSSVRSSRGPSSRLCSSPVHSTHPNCTSIWSNNKTVSMSSYSDSNLSDSSSISLSNISSIVVHSHQHSFEMSCSNLEDVLHPDQPLQSTFNYPLNSTQRDTTQHVQSTSSQRGNIAGRSSCFRQEVRDCVHKANYSVSTKNNIKRKMKQYRKQIYKHGISGLHVLAVV